LKYIIKSGIFEAIKFLCVHSCFGRYTAKGWQKVP